MSATRIRNDRPMPEIARACVDVLLAGGDAEIAAAPWRRPGLTNAIAAEQRARGAGTGRWQFIADTNEPVDVDAPSAGDILGWDASRPDSHRHQYEAVPTQRATPTPVYTIPEPAPAPAPMPAPVVQRPVHVNHPVVHPPVIPTPPPVAPPVAVVQLGQPAGQSGSMMQAAYAVLALSQPVMTGGLRPGPHRQVTAGTPGAGRRWSAAQALAELAELEGL